MFDVLVKKTPWQVAVSILMVAAAIVLRIEFLSVFGQGYPFVSFYPVVVIAALYCGLAGGLISTVLSVVAADYFFMAPHGFMVAAFADRIYAAVFVLEGFVISYAAHWVRRVEAAKAQHELELERQRAADRLRAGEELRQSEQRLRLVLEGGQMGMWQWDISSNTLECDPKACELLNLTTETGSTTLDLFLQSLLAEDALNFRGELDRVVAEEQDFSHESRIVRPDGETRWVAGRGRVLRDRAGWPCSLVAICYDITPTKLVEEALRKSEAEARARADELAVLMDTAPAMIFIANDPDCRYMTCSKKVREMMNVPQGGNVSKSAPLDERTNAYRTIKDGHELAPEELPMQVATKEGREIRNVELTLLFADGSFRDILGNASPLFDDAGNIRGAIGVFLDITERKKIQAALQGEVEERLRALEELHERDRMLVQQGRLVAIGETISNVAHQWRQPLNTLGLIIQELPLMYKSGDFSEEYLRARVDKAAMVLSHMSQTIEDFSNFFKPGREPVRFRVGEVVNRTLFLIEESFKKLAISITVESFADPLVAGYPNEFSQVLLNLFLNARDAFLDRPGGPDHVIRVRVSVSGHKAVVTVTDNAGGIPEEVLDSIFEPYFTTKASGKGTGIGLFLSRNIIEKNMKGALTARNVDGGAEFTIEIECADEQD